MLNYEVKVYYFLLYSLKVKKLEFPIKSLIRIINFKTN
ncbi:hypothetical protein J2X17_002392 [Flavobacterium aquidurense]|nr:hypothetical protein [Flavobacterium aquidurense]